MRFQVVTKTSPKKLIAIKKLLQNKLFCAVTPVTPLFYFSGSHVRASIRAFISSGVNIKLYCTQ